MLFVKVQYHDLWSLITQQYKVLSVFKKVIVKKSHVGQKIVWTNVFKAGPDVEPVRPPVQGSIGSTAIESDN